MIPDQYGSSTPPDVNALFDEEGLPVGVTFDRSGESVRFDDGGDAGRAVSLTQVGRPEGRLLQSARFGRDALQGVPSPKLQAQTLMCGIAGIVSFDPRDRVDERRLTTMRDVMRHRGPDGEGLFLDGPVGLAHRRLSIVDVSAGHQPMSNEDASIWVVFNGEIYNHADLRPRLEQRGHHYRTRSDTETILHLYEEKGDAVVDDLHGMFAFAIWDRTRQRLLLARDRLGIKPLYYTLTGTELLFASEIKGLLAALRVRPGFNHEALPEFLATRFLSGEETFFSNVRKLMPGHVASWSAKRRLSDAALLDAAAPVGAAVRQCRVVCHGSPWTAGSGCPQPPHERCAARDLLVGRH